MNYMVFLVLDDPARLDEVIQAWDAHGIGGATIIESTGIHRRLRQFIPMRYNLQPSQNVEEGHLTLLAVVKSRKAVTQCLAATESVVGNLDEPNSGVFAAWPVSIVKGLPQGEE